MAIRRIPNAFRKTSPCFVGIDVSKDKLDVFIRLSQKSLKVDNKAFGPLVKKLKKLNPELIVLETTYGYEIGVLEALSQAGLKVYREHLLKVYHHAKERGKLAKMDRLDTSNLDHYAECFAKDITIWNLPSQEHRELQQLVTRQKQLVEQRTLLIDDTMIAKPHSEKIEGVKWQYASFKEKVLPGINLLLAAWVTEGNIIHILELFFPQDGNRNELVQALFQNMQKGGFEPDYVLFDAWDAASKTLNLIHSQGWTYVCRIRGNRLFNGKPIHDHLFYGAQGISSKLKGVYQQVQVVKHDDRFLLTNSLIPHTSQTLAACYQERWVIETVFRDLKSVLHLEKCTCRNLEARFNHVLCVLEAYLYLRQAFPVLSVQAAQQQCLKLYRCPNCRHDLSQLLPA